MSGNLTLRPAEPADSALVFEWRNQPTIIAHSSSRSRVSLSDHTSWFAASLQNPDRLILILLNGGTPIGLCRFDRTDDEAVISVYLAEGNSGRGHGIAGIRMGCAAAVRHWPDLAAIRADVRLDNPQGLSAFPKAGFSREDQPRADGHATFLLSAQNLA